MAASRAWRNGLRTFIALEQPITQELIRSHPIIEVSPLPACIQLCRAQSDARGAHQSSLNTWQLQPLSLAALPIWYDVPPYLSFLSAYTCRRAWLITMKLMATARTGGLQCTAKPGTAGQPDTSGLPLGWCTIQRLGRSCDIPGCAAGPHSLHL